MWKTISDWLLAFFNMSREIQEHRETIRQMEERLRNMEEAIKLLAQEQRHTRELEFSEREKFLLCLQTEVWKLKELKPPRRKKRASEITHQKKYLAFKELAHETGLGEKTLPDVKPWRQSHRAQPRRHCQNNCR